MAVFEAFCSGRDQNSNQPPCGHTPSTFDVEAQRARRTLNTIEPPKFRTISGKAAIITSISNTLFVAMFVLEFAPDWYRMVHRRFLFSVPAGQVERVEFLVPMTFGLFLALGPELRQHWESGSPDPAIYGVMRPMFWNACVLAVVVRAGLMPADGTLLSGDGQTFQSLGQGLGDLAREVSSGKGFWACC